MENKGFAFIGDNLQSRALVLMVFEPCLSAALIKICSCGLSSVTTVLVLLMFMGDSYENFVDFPVRNGASFLGS